MGYCRPILSVWRRHL